MNRHLRPSALHQLETEHAAIERQRPIDVGDFQMHMPDADAGIDRCVVHFSLPSQLAFAVTLRASGATRKAVMRLRVLRRT